MKVKVKDWGKIYTTYEKWFEEKDCVQYLNYYYQGESLIDHFSHYFDYTPFDKEGNKLDMTNIFYEVVKTGKHTSMDYTLYLIQEPMTNKMYLIEKSAVDEIRS